MKHAGAAALDQLEALLAQLRLRKPLVERGRGVFYRGARAFLHFHEDPSGLYADLRGAHEWERYAVSKPSSWQALLGRIDAALGGPAPAGER